MVDLPPGMLQTILDDPEDDGIRLIAADWWDENGDADDQERAEFVRVQVRKESEPGWHGFLCLPENPCRNCRRERKLLREDGPLRHLFGRYFSTPEGQGFWIGDACFYAAFRRGFVAEVFCTLADFEAHAAALFACQPIEAVRLTDKGGHYSGTFPAGWFLTQGRVGDGFRNTVPPWLWKRLPLAAKYNVIAVFESECEVEAALSAALVFFGRNAASRLKQTSQSV